MVNLWREVREEEDVGGMNGELVSLSVFLLSDLDVWTAAQWICSGA